MIEKNTDPLHLLADIAKETMLARALKIDYSDEVKREMETIKSPAIPETMIPDLRHLLWFSIDNDDSRDLDQITYAERVEGGSYRIYVGIADVDALVKQGSATDLFAQNNTVTVYTPTFIFPMLPEKLSTDFTSLNENEDRVSMVVELVVNSDGSMETSKIYQAYVRNQAKLAYNNVGSWLEGTAELPVKEGAVPGIEQQLKLQDEITSILKEYRRLRGALTLETIEPVAVIADDQIIDIKPLLKNRARDLIEQFMIAANTSVANFLTSSKLPSFRRVVRIPKRWDRIVEIAEEHGFTLPKQPDAKILDEFLLQEQKKDPLHFPDLSLTIIKLLGNGEYVVDYPGEVSVGHFSLALKNYTHATAPNRRYPDLITQRLIKSALRGEQPAYTGKELDRLAQNCSKKEDAAEKVHRKMVKSAAAFVLKDHLNEQFEGLVTGAGPNGTWVRIFHPPVEGKIVQGYEKLDVGNKVLVKLIHVDIKMGYIDFINL